MTRMQAPRPPDLHRRLLLLWQRTPPAAWLREFKAMLADRRRGTRVNVLIGWPSELTVADIAALGVRRISVGGALARAAWGGFMRAARTLAEQGSFAGFQDAASGAELNAQFAAR